MNSSGTQFRGHSFIIQTKSLKAVRSAFLSYFFFHGKIPFFFSPNTFDVSAPVAVEEIWKTKTCKNWQEFKQKYIMYTHSQEFKFAENKKTKKPYLNPKRLVWPRNVIEFGFILFLFFLLLLLFFLFIDSLNFPLILSFGSLLLSELLWTSLALWS